MSFNISKRLLILIGLLTNLLLVLSIERNQLFPFGSQHGDEKLLEGDEINSPAITLNTPIKYYDSSYSTLWINTNGIISFDQYIPSYDSNIVLPFNLNVIAPFLADIDTTSSGNIYYRESEESDLLERARIEISRAFAEDRNFRPNSLFIVTWEEVGYYDNQFEPTNTFQAVIASDEYNSFSFFLYPNDGLNWLQGQEKNPPHQNSFAQVGFDSNSNLHHILQGSGSPGISKLAIWSNVDTEGLWLFKIGILNRGNIITPMTYSQEENQEVLPSLTCRAAGQQKCHSNANCQDYAQGFCCECISPYVGNGIDCHNNNVAIRLSGKVTGTLNDINLEDHDLHCYIVTQEGRVYLAISQIPVSLGQAMKTLVSIGTGFAFAFAVPQEANVKNGFMIMGAQFNRTAIVRYTDTGEEVTIKQTFVGFDRAEHLKVITEINGHTPKFSENARIEIEDYKEDFKREAPGLIKLHSEPIYRIDDVSKQLSVEEIINYHECLSNPVEDQDVLIVSINKHFASYSNNEHVIRYSHTNTISNGIPKDDPCSEANCHSHAFCISSENSFSCQCNVGYYGDGTTCQDVDECQQSNQFCNVNAICYNLPGTYECQCKPGFNGDGRICTAELPTSGDNDIYDDSCMELRNCHIDGKCVLDDYTNRYKCICNQHFSGDGYFCIRDAHIGDPQQSTDEDCSLNQRICDHHAQCIMNEELQVYNCQCNPGFDGDGKMCIRYDCMRNPSLCNQDSKCDWTGSSHECICNPGFKDDGYNGCAPISFDGSSNSLVYAHGMFILQTPFKATPTHKGKLITFLSGQLAVAIEVDCNNRDIVWTDVVGKTISKSKSDGTNLEVLHKELGSPEGLAIDWIGHNIYWTDSLKDKIFVSRLNGSFTKTILSTGLVNPRSIVVDPIRGFIFWTDWNRDSPKIEMANLDGSNRKVIIKENLALPNALTIDSDSEIICWADAGIKKIECASYEGRNRRLVTASAGYPFGLAYDNNIFYWTDWEKSTISNINKFGEVLNEDVEQPSGANGKLYGIAVSRSSCPHGLNSCSYNNGGCKYLCLANSNGTRTCVCPDDIAEDECQQYS